MTNYNSYKDVNDILNNIKAIHIAQSTELLIRLKLVGKRETQWMRKCYKEIQNTGDKIIIYSDNGKTKNYFYKQLIEYIEIRYKESFNNFIQRKKIKYYIDTNIVKSNLSQEANALYEGKEKTIIKI